ncbi:bacteriocin immunity protein [Pseudomonas guariconensis]|nr:MULTISPECIES: bacteriocin immunity protein [Pseudomonas]MCO7637099.1 bacteriocin immunity protein [Pseudomonas sp. S 311-6]MCO7515819.1 bacteriocin immunity protein [Pseudomonas putida]MCO7566132.1 bacteriocin immunity protein [Pseudomonas mosselii]MCO7605819.1 bacteriocin immunity protein [Pseudomonas guariconensis]MCO7617122.1 bacteriocin immunity protein [Pseudomonas guariconensis]
MNFQSKTTIEEYTEAEFLSFLREFFEDTNGLKGAALENYIGQLTDHFERVTEHPSGSDLIFYPAPGVEDGPEGVLAEVKKWRAANGLPGFKSS